MLSSTDWHEQVAPDEAERFARHGLFAAPGRHPAWVRLSNGGPYRAAENAASDWARGAL